MKRLSDGQVVALAKKYYPVWDARIHGFASAIQEAHRELNAVQPIEEPKMAPTNDPREMRKRIHEMARYGTRLDDKESSSVSAAANVALPIMNWGESEGWSGEDTMTAIAYHALLRYEAAMDQLLNAEMLKVPNRVIFTPEKKT